MKKIFCFCFIIVISYNCLGAQVSIDSTVKFQALPSDPVLDMLGFNQGEIEQTGTISKFLASISAAADLQGRLNTGYGITIAPFQVFMGSKLQLSDYIKNWGTRFLANSQISFGTAKSSGSDTATDWGIGIKLVFYTTGDGRRDQNKINALIANSQKILKSLPDIASVTQLQRDSITKVSNAITNDIDEYKSIKSITPDWNNNSWDFFAGFVYRASQSKIQESEIVKLRLFTNAGIGWGDFQFLGQASYVQMFVVDSTQWRIAVKIKTGNEDARIGIGFSGGGDKRDTMSSNAGTIILSTEFRVSDVMWVVAGISCQASEKQKPIWIPNLTIKATAGAFGL